MNKFSTESVSTIRTVVQWCFLFWVVGIGIRFGMFVNRQSSLSYADYQRLIPLVPYLSH